MPDVCWYKEDERFEEIREKRLLSLRVKPGSWFVRVQNDPYRMVRGEIMRPTEAGDYATIPTIPTWEHAKQLMPPPPSPLPSVPTRVPTMSPSSNNSFDIVMNQSITAATPTSPPRFPNPLPPSLFLTPSPVAPAHALDWNVSDQVRFDAKPVPAGLAFSQSNWTECRQLCEANLACGAFAFNAHHSWCFFKGCLDTELENIEWEVNAGYVLHYTHRDSCSGTNAGSASTGQRRRQRALLAASQTLAKCPGPKCESPRQMGETGVDHERLRQLRASLTSLLHRVPAGPELTLEQTEVKLLNLKFENQQPQHAAAMQQNALSFAVLTEQVKSLQEGASSCKGEKAVATTTGDAELEIKKKLPHVPYAPNNPFPTRPSTMEDLMPKVYDLYGDKTHALLSKKSNSFMKYEQMILGPDLAYFHDAVVYEEDTMDWLQELPAGQPLDDTGELYDRLVKAHNTKKSVYSLLRNRYTMLTLQASLDAEGGGTDAVQAKLAFMEEKVKRRTLQEEVRSFKGAWRVGDASSEAGARVLPYMDDFLVIVKTQDEAYVQRDRVSRLLVRLGFFRNEKKGHWEPTQVAEHLGLQVDLKDGQFRVTKARLQKIHVKAKALICRAAR
ncbi:hypothetical protein CYMTET_41046 [Cymbomonas tetramitiformis]|uniref:Apple domain-containing protein n=1 Tax=Cymbomonas tetramitiformis TaxID=36881 RepID=A0AAE0C6W0_9CHLO|nr:hypothetical protein CYMTET_41046 [Cymbomonas tetramitiformis]